MLIIFPKKALQYLLLVYWGDKIWSIGFTLNIIASGKAEFAVSYGLGQGVILVAAFWGVFIWKEFKGVQKVNSLLSFMFLFYIVGLLLIIAAKLF